MKQRNAYNWRLDVLNEDEKLLVNDWINNQANINQSINNLMLHIIHTLGTDDVMKYENQKQLFTFLNGLQQSPVVETKKEKVKEEKEVVVEEIETVKEESDFPEISANDF